MVKLWHKTVAALAASLASLAANAVEFNMTPGVTDTSHLAYGLHMKAFWICVVIGIVVFGAMFYSIVKHRRSVHPNPAHFHENTLVEIVWTIIPVLILVALAVPAIKTLIAMEDTRDADMTVMVTGSQWKWHYKYMDANGKDLSDISFYSNLSTPADQYENFDGAGAPKGEHYLREVDHELVIPTGKKVRFLMTSEDVIHSWWVPAFAIKKDAIPGFINETWTRVNEPGTYRGVCAELCGKAHGFMPIVVKAVSPADFDQWVADTRTAMAEAKKAAEADVNRVWSKEDLMAKGEEVYVKNCQVCHQPGGVGMPPSFPALKGSKMATEKDQIPAHIHQVIKGKNAMPPFGAMLSDMEIAAVVTYERNAFGNNTGDVVQPKDVKAAR